jgi:hypothetical protein
LCLAVSAALLLGPRSSVAQELRFAYRAATLATPANDAGLVADALGAGRIQGDRSAQSRSSSAAHKPS